MNLAEPAASSANSAVDQIATELERVVRRWQQLPLDHALSVCPRVHGLVQHLADQVAPHLGMPITPVPDLGPAVVMDQLRVMVFDYQESGLDLKALALRLTELRRSLP
ncbi:MAG: hypothetical protein WBG36_14470 [Ornithinimicrobium sp.]